MAWAITFLGKYDECLRWYFKSKPLYTTVKETAGLAELYSDTTIFYLRVKKFKEADEVNKKAIQRTEITGNEKMLPTAVNNRGLMFLNDNKLDSAVVYFKNSNRL
ncbi:hypothetical protein NAF17_04595 [Mucilaginibacter sp. RB4R14]|uniref:hypothetical protein n=1 Tax=Mucilaginibacter aurantiaciroseus TaxID=2949308 RepID=UPI002091B48F|nr:hypothetical protein [Mucilaginibacter aurantiaciroseus]MCO5934810.1 hypothetical protein [Mucilaginibacter aurantiaciroseus]